MPKKHAPYADYVPKKTDSFVRLENERMARLHIENFVKKTL